MSLFLDSLKALAIALFATIVIEVSFSILLFGLRERRELLVVALAQVVTNPVVGFVSLAFCWRPELPIRSAAWMALLIVELAAIVVEGQLYRMVHVGMHAWRMSLTLNLLSFILGLALGSAGLL